MSSPVPPRPTPRPVPGRDDIAGMPKELPIFALSNGTMHGSRTCSYLKGRRVTDATVAVAPDQTLAAEPHCRGNSPEWVAYLDAAEQRREAENANSLIAAACDGDLEVLARLYWDADRDPAAWPEVDAAAVYAAASGALTLAGVQVLAAAAVIAGDNLRANPESARQLGDAAGRRLAATSPIDLEVFGKLHVIARRVCRRLAGVGGSFETHEWHDVHDDLRFGLHQLELGGASDLPTPLQLWEALDAAVVAELESMSGGPQVDVRFDRADYHPAVMAAERLWGAGPRTYVMPMSAALADLLQQVRRRGFEVEPAGTLIGPAAAVPVATPPRPARPTAVIRPRRSGPDLPPPARIR